MNESEMLDLLSELETLLAGLGLGAAVDQERAAAAEGRVVVAREDYEPPGPHRKGPRPERGDVRLAAMSTADRVGMLLDMVEVAVGGTFAMTDRVRSFVDARFRSQDLAEPVMSFSPDLAEGFISEDTREWDLPGRGSLEARRHAVRDVLTDLEELREQVGVQRGRVLGERRDLRGSDAQRMLGWA